MDRINLCFVSGSHRAESYSRRICGALVSTMRRDFGDRLNGSDDLIDLSETRLPLWDEGVWAREANWEAALAPLSERLRYADGFVFVTPEWGGMVPPGLKNFLLLYGNEEFAHKPAMIVAISSGSGGTYPITELRTTAYKNNHICWTPEHVIIRKVRDYWTGGKDKEYIDRRIKYACSVLIDYAAALKPARQALLSGLQEFPYGM